MKNKFDTNKLVGLALFTAIVVVLQMLGTFIRFGTFAISLVLIPIVIGAALYGWKSGAWLGFVFGVVVLISGDASLFLGINPFGTVVTVLLKGALAGLLAGLAYKLLEKVNTYVAVLAAAIVCPVVNSGIFFLGCNIFFLDAIKGWATDAGFTGNVGTYIVLFLIGGNFIFELLFNVVLSHGVLRLINTGKNLKAKRNSK